MKLDRAVLPYRIRFIGKDVGVYAHDSPDGMSLNNTLHIIVVGLNQT
jgi:hypothetical protein